MKRRGTYSVKLGDFGLAKSLDESSIFAQTHVGTPYYMSPEQIQSKSYNEKSDIWSLGCIVYEMAMLSPPFKASNYLHLAEKIKLGQYKKVQSRNYSDELESAIAMMLTVDSNKRAAVEELLCLPRIQFTSKMLRLDRRYSQLKKKEQQFHLKMQEFESKFKKRSLALLKKENALKMKESELQRKEKEVLLFSSNTSTHSNQSHQSRQSRSSQTSPNTNCLEMGSQNSDKSVPSEMSSKVNSAQNVVSPSFTLGRATSNTSTLNTSKTSTMESSNGDTSTLNTIDCNHDIIDERKEESPQKEDSNVLWSDITMHSVGSKGTSQILLNDTRSYLMKRVNLSDLSGSDDKSNGKLSGSDDKSNETIEEEDNLRGSLREQRQSSLGTPNFAEYLADGVRNMRLDADQSRHLSQMQMEWKLPEEDEHDCLETPREELRRRRNFVERNDSSHSFTFGMKETPRDSYIRTSHIDIKSKSVRAKKSYY